MDFSFKDKLEKKKEQIGLIGIRLEIDRPEGDEVSASIDYGFSNINISLGKDFNPVFDRASQNYCQIKNISDGIEKVAEDCLEHEAGHRENPTETKYGCPFNLEIHDRIKDAVSSALTRKGKTGLEAYVTNAFEDILDNINCRRKTDFSGQILFWNYQGKKSGGKFEPFCHRNKNRCFL